MIMGVFVAWYEFEVLCWWGFYDVFPRMSRGVAEMQGEIPCSAFVIRAVLQSRPLGADHQLRTYRTAVNMASLLEVWAESADAHSAGAVTRPIVAD